MGESEMVVLKDGFEAMYSEATFKRIAEDAVFFRKQAEETNDGEKKRYSRIIIILMAFYLESVANLLFDEFVSEDLDLVDERKDLPKPIRRFRVVYNELANKELTLNTDGIQDIFTIRNKVIAHPAGRAKEQIDGIRQSRIDTKISYKKFTRFPHVYSYFTISEADTVLNEVKEFLTSFFKSLKHKLTKEQFDEWWPKELTEWSE